MSRPLEEYDLRVVEDPTEAFPEGVAIISRLGLPKEVGICGWYHPQGRFSGLWVYPFGWLEDAEIAVENARTLLASDVEVSDR